MPVVSFADFLLPASQLPLHLAIKEGREADALHIIDAFQPHNVSFVGNLLTDCEVIPGGIRTEGKEFSVQNVSEAPGTHFLQGRIRQGTFYPNHNLPPLAEPIAFCMGASSRYYVVVDRNHPNNIFHRDREEQKTALHLAAEKGLTNIVSQLLSKNMPVDLIDGYGNTALHYAAMSGNEAMISLLLDRGASIEVVTALGQHPAELLKPGVAYSDAMLARLFQPDPLLPTVKATAANELHTAIQQGNLSAAADIAHIKQLALNPALLIRSPSGKLPSELVQQKAALLNAHGGAPIPAELITYLHFREELHSLNHSAAINHTRASLASDERDSDTMRIGQSIRALSLIEKYCHNPADVTYNQRTVLDSLSIAASQIFSISFNLKKAGYDKMPWPSLEQLRYIATTPELPIHTQLTDRYLSSVVLGELPGVKIELSAIKQQLEKEKTDSIRAGDEGSYYRRDTATHPVMNLPTTPSLYLLTDPSKDMHSLQRLHMLCESAAQCDYHTERGRLALLNTVKLVGEFTKFQHMSRKLSDAVKSEIHDMDWKKLSSLRNYLAKYIEDGSLPTPVRGNVKHLIQHGDDGVFQAIQQSLQTLEGVIGAFIPQHEQRIGNQHLMEALYQAPHPVTLSLPIPDQQALVQDLQATLQPYTDRIAQIDTELAVPAISKSQKKKLEKERTKQERYRTDCHTKITGFEAEINTGIIKKQTESGILNFFHEEKQDPTQQQWKNRFAQLALSTTYPGFDTLKTYLETDHAHPVPLFRGERLKRFMAQKAIEHIDNLGEMLIGDQALYQTIVQNPSILRTTSPEARAVAIRIQELENNRELRFAANQRISDTFQYLQLLDIDANKQFRHAIEHQHILFETTGHRANIGGFMEMLAYSTEIRPKLEQAYQPNAVNQLLQSIRTSHRALA